MYTNALPAYTGGLYVYERRASSFLLQPQVSAIISELRFGTPFSFQDMQERRGILQYM